MDAIRLATPEEIESIAGFADLSYATSVVTLGGKDFAVFRNCFEIDPYIWDENTTAKRKMLFSMNLETALRLQGIKEIYFNVKADDAAFLALMQGIGAERVSTAPEYRFKKVL